jgi:signal transduction histidine kinase
VEEYGAVSVGETARGAWEMIDSRSARLSVEDCTVTGDAGQLRALFENLFRNAIGHGGDDVTVRVGPVEGGFYVEDTGDGIAVDDPERVFEHGFTTGYGGSGVGLTIVRRIATAHGLGVSLSESGEGGARFEFREPADEP